MGSARVHLRDVTDEDIAVFFDHQRDPEANAMSAFAARDRDEHVAHWSKIRRDGSCVTKTIVAEGDVAGNIGSWMQDGHREIGYWIGKEFWGRGIATAAVRAFVGVVTERPLFAWVAEHNVGSVKVLEKCGFVVAAHESPSDSHGINYLVLRLAD
jgi:RimJ/RimL family protein N-acetyltransferase